MRKVSTISGLIFFAFTLACRFSYSLADFYAERIYPTLSLVLSWVSSFVNFSLQDVALIILVLSALGILVSAIVQKWSVKRCLKHELSIVLWTYVWFYMAWCINYSRSSLYMRTGEHPSSFNEAEFKEFINTFATDINEVWTAETADDPLLVEEEVKGFYAQVPSRYGLATPRSWQHPKRTFFNGVYSSVGILGFMEPLFSESCLNQDLQPFDYPFVYAHEYAHLLGISSEAECNWWAYHACISSQNKAVRYSGMKGIISHVMNNVYRFLSEEDSKAWYASLRPEVLTDLKTTREHWQNLLSPTRRSLHEMTYDTFLKSNNISSGLQNYSEVVGMLMAIEYEDGE